MKLKQHAHLLFAICAIFLAGCSAKAKLERHVNRADLFFEKGDFEKARIEYLNAFRLDEKNAHVAARLGETFLKRGEIRQAFQLFSHSVALQPTNNDARVKLASVLLLGGEPAKAREQALQVLNQAPTHPDGLLVFANASVRTNEVSEARARLESLALSEPDNPHVFLALGSVAQRDGAPTKAEAALNRAVQLDSKSARNNLALGSFYFLRGETNKADLYLRTAMELSPPRSVERLGFAEFLFKSGRADEAESILLDATAKETDFAPAWNLLTQIAFRRGDTNKAGGYIGQSLQVDPGNREAVLNQARLKIASRDPSVIADLERLSTENPRDSQVHFQLATAHAASDDLLKALAALDKAIAANTNHVDAHLLRSRLLISRGDWNNAVFDLTQLVERFPGVPQISYLLAAAYRAQGNYADALNVYSQMAKDFPADPQAHQFMGMVHRQRNNLSEARQAFEGALRIEPDYLAAIDSLVDLDIFEKRFAAAHDRLRKYLEKYPKSPLPLLLQGKVFVHEQKTAEAEQAVSKAIELEPEFVQAHRALAELYVRSGQTDKAIAKFESILAKNDRDIASLIQSGMLYESKSDFARAREKYEAVLKVNPNSVAALNNLAYILSERQGEVERALEYARTARRVAPNDPFAADTYGWILWKKGDYAEALGAIQQSAERLPEQPEVQYHLGMAHYMVGNAQVATMSLTKAIQGTNEFLGKDIARNALALLQVDIANPSPESVSFVERHVEENPGDVFGALQLARVYETRSDWSRAHQTYESALKANPRSHLLLAGLAALYAGPLHRTDEAMELARKAWAASPGPRTAAALGPVAYLAGDYKWANGRLLEAVRVQPSPEVIYYKGLTAYALGNIHQAAADLSRVSESAELSDDKKTLARTALLVSKFHNDQSSVEAVQTAVEAAKKIDPRFIPNSVADGLLAERNGDFLEARRAYETALETRPGLLVAQRQLALVLEKLGDDAKAHQLATALRVEFPEDAGLSKVLGKVAYRRSDFQEAVRHLRSAAVQKENDSELLYYLGMALYRLDDHSARESLSKAISLDPGSKLAADAKKALSELN